MSDELSIPAAIEPSPFTVGLTRGKTGHVHSPWWTYDWQKYNPSGAYEIGSHFHALRAESVRAFSAALGLDERDVLVSVRTNPLTLETEWRCGSARTVAPTDSGRQKLLDKALHPAVRSGKFLTP